jgi:flagellar hook-associated protein 1
MSTFSGLSTALSALYAQRRGMDVTAQNIANANSDGYSRQRVDLSAVGAGVPAIHSVADGIGSGVTVNGVRRLQDTFLEARGRIAHAQDTYLSGQQQIYSRVEQAFGEPSETGLQAQLAEFWSAWHDVANRPGDPAARTQVVQRGVILSDTLRDTHNTLSSLWSATRDQIDAVAVEINTTAAEVARLNQAVVRAGQSELPVNELADRRDQLVLHLAQLAGASALPRADGSVDVQLGGSALVSGGNARGLTASGAHSLDQQATSPVALRWQDSGAAVSVSSGQLASLMESTGVTVPHYAQALDELARNLRDEVNARHRAGKDLAGRTDQDFFSGDGAATLRVALTSGGQVAAAGRDRGALDGSNADALALLAGSTTGPDRRYRQLVVGLGVETQTINRRVEVQRVVTDDVDAAREGVSGVNIDEEMTNMISYERAYQAASRVVNAVDEMLDTLINRTGMVGR